MKSLFSESGVMMLIINPDTGQIEDANPAACDFYGYSANKFKSLNLSDLNLMPENEIKEEIENTRKTGKKYFTFQHKLANGEIRSVEVYSATIQFAEETKLFSIIHDITERINTEKENQKITTELSNAFEELYASNDELRVKNLLIENERKQFLSLLDSIPENIYVADIYTHEILFANKNLKKTTGRNIIGEQCHQAIHNNPIACQFCPINNILNNDEPYFREYYNSVLEKHFFVMDRKIKWTDQRDVHFQMAVDITERKKAEEALKESEAKFKTISNSANDAIILIDHQGKISFWNAAAEKIFQYTESEVLGKELHKIISPEKYKEQQDKGFETFKKSGKGNAIGKTTELEAIRKSGEVFPVEVSLSAIKIKDHWNAVGIVRDITDRKEAEERIKSNSTRLHDLLELSQQSTNNKQQIFDYALNTAIKITKSEYGFVHHYSEAEEKFYLNSWSDSVLPDCKTIEKQTVYQLKNTGLWGEVVRQRKAIMVNDLDQPNPLQKGFPDGHVKIKRFLSVPFIIENKIAAVVAVANKTDEYDDDDILQLNLLMETVWNIYNKKETEAKIHNLNKELKDAIATKDKFFNIIAHDLKNPFSAILGFSDLLINHFDDLNNDKIKRYIQLINESGKNTFTLLENLLEWSRSQQNKIPFNPQPTNLYHLVKETHILVNNSTEAKNLQVKIDVPQDIILKADSKMLKTVIRNLLSNAIKFTPDNGLIRISAKEEDETVQIKISDSGIGMDEKTKNALFKIGESKSQKGTRGESGTGFGLLLCKEFVEKHNGTINVESEPEKGSAFIVSLPGRYSS
jgi:two-component system, OmpR family, phosphate regulon sensor histidine kinase PhoR